MGSCLLYKILKQMSSKVNESRYFMWNIFQKSYQIVYSYSFYQVRELKSLISSFFFFLLLSVCLWQVLLLRFFLKVISNMSHWQEKWIKSSLFTGLFILLKCIGRNWHSRIDNWMLLSLFKSMLNSLCLQRRSVDIGKQWKTTTTLLT